MGVHRSSHIHPFPRLMPRTRRRRRHARAATSARASAARAAGIGRRRSSWF